MQLLQSSSEPLPANKNNNLQVFQPIARYLLGVSYVVGEKGVSTQMSQTGISLAYKPLPATS